jgi:hypothetical protein
MGPPHLKWERRWALPERSLPLCPRPMALLPVSGVVGKETVAHCGVRQNGRSMSDLLGRVPVFLPVCMCSASKICNLVFNTVFLIMHISCWGFHYILADK